MTMTDYGVSDASTVSVLIFSARTVSGKKVTGMCFSKGNKMIRIEQFDRFEKRPVLYVGEGNKLLKVASFGSEEQARIFVDTLKEFFGYLLVEEDGDGDGT